MKMGRRKKEKSTYKKMVVDLARFVLVVANKDNPTNEELKAMVEISKMLFRTI